MKKIIIAFSMVLLFVHGSYSESTPGAVLEPVPEMGVLGHKLMTVLTTEGVRETRNPGKLTHARMIVVEPVNDVKVEKPVHLYIKKVDTDSLKEGTRCTFKGYENGEWIGCDTCQNPRQFFHYFVVSDIIRPEGLEIR